MLLVDGLALAYRAYHAIPPLSSKAGEPTNALFGFIKMVRQMDEQWQPTHRAVVFDGGLPASRLNLLPSYKAQRDPMPEELRRQLDPMTQFLHWAGWPSVRPEGEEADDALATLSVRASLAGGRVLVASSDKDLLQIVSPQVGVVAPTKDSKPQGPEEVRARFGVGPEQMVDLLALMGDQADNIPGVPGIGPKTAAQLLARYGALDEVWAQLDQVDPPRIRELLRLHRDVVERNRKLMRLDTDLPGLPPLDALMARRPDFPELIRFLEQRDLHGLARSYRETDLQLF